MPQIDFKALPALIREELTHDQPASFISMGRNLTYLSDPTANPTVDKPDAVFECLIMIRNNQYNVMQSEDGGKEITEDLFKIASEVLWLWYRCAVDFYEGHPAPELDDEEVKFSFDMPARNSAPNVTCFGSIQDKEGRYFSLTVTDQSDIWSIHKMMQGATQIWDWATDNLSNGLDHNVGGRKDRTTKVGSEVKAKKAPARKPKFGADKKKSKKDKVDTKSATVCRLFSQLLEVPEGSSFALNLQSMNVKDNPKDAARVIYFNGFTEDVNGEMIAITGRNQSGYYFELDYRKQPRQEFLDLVAIIEEKGSDGIVTFNDGEAVMYGKKKIAASGNAYYTDLSVQLTS